MDMHRGVPTHLLRRILNEDRWTLDSEIGRAAILRRTTPSEPSLRERLLDLRPLGRRVVGHRHVHHLFAGVLRIADIEDRPLLARRVGRGFCHRLLP